LASQHTYAIIFIIKLQHQVSCVFFLVNIITLSLYKACVNNSRMHATLIWVSDQAEPAGFSPVYRSWAQFNLGYKYIWQNLPLCQFPLFYSSFKKIYGFFVYFSTNFLLILVCIFIL
jgi:hypothetical protein